MRTLLVVVLLLSVARADSTPAQLAKDRIEAAGLAYAGVLAGAKAGRATAEQAAVWSVRWVEAIADDTGIKPEALAKALAEHVTRVKELEAFVQKQFQAGIAGAPDVSMAAYFRIEAELWKARGKIH